MQQQLLLPTRIARPRRDGKHTWHVGKFDRSGLAAFVHIIRSTDDPPETARRGGGHRGTSSQDPAGVNTHSAAHWRTKLEALLSDGESRTFNRIAVELTGRTADVFFQSKLDKTLWTMVEVGQVECTTEAPLLFRRRVGQGRAS